MTDVDTPSPATPPPPSPTETSVPPEPPSDRPEPAPKNSVSSPDVELNTFERDDRDARGRLYEGVETLCIMLEMLTLVEKYGLSLSFDDQRVEWTCGDPKGAYRGTSNTPVGAVFVWDSAREEGVVNDPEADAPEAQDTLGASYPPASPRASSCSREQDKT